MQRDKLLDFINKKLRNNQIKDVSKNGLQVEGKKEIKKILFAVSISIDVIKKAIEIKADMIIVHHGLFWGKEKVIVSKYKEKIELLIKNDINLCAWHLPLDMNEEIGNNISILKYFNVKNIKPFGFYDGLYIGYQGELKKSLTLKEIEKTLKERLNAKSFVLPYGKEKIKTISVISGDAPKLFEEAIDKKLDLFLTGETSEPCFELARENNINFIACGHYNSEKSGIFSLKNLIEKKFKLKTFFYDTNNPI